MKRKLGILLILFACLFAACGTKTENETPNEQPTQAVEQTPEVTEEPAEEPAKEPAATATPTPTEIPSLKDVMAQHNMKAGTCMSAYMMSNKNCQKAILKHFNSITFENEMKPDSVLDKEASVAGVAEDSTFIGVKFDAAANIIEFCKKNNIFNSIE